MGPVAVDPSALIERVDLAPVHICSLFMVGFVGLRLAARRPELLRSLMVVETTAGTERSRNRQKHGILIGLSQWLRHGVVSRRITYILYALSTLNDPKREEHRHRWRTRLVSNRRSFFEWSTVSLTGRAAVHCHRWRPSCALSADWGLGISRAARSG